MNRTTERRTFATPPSDGATDICFSTRLVEACPMVVYISHVMECGQEPGQHPTWGDVSPPLPMPQAWLLTAHGQPVNAPLGDSFWTPLGAKLQAKKRTAWWSPSVASPNYCLKSGASRRSKNDSGRTIKRISPGTAFARSGDLFDSLADAVEFKIPFCITSWVTASTLHPQCHRPESMPTRTARCAGEGCGSTKRASPLASV